MFQVKRAVLVMLLILVQLSPRVADATTANPAAVCTGSSCVITFTYSGDYYQWTVPSGVNSLSVDLYGASGGTPWKNTVSAGKGGRVQGTLRTTPGQILYIYVGGQGSQAQTSSNSTTGGWNGGGLGGTGNGSNPSCYCGTGGGGASDIRTTVAQLSSRLIVAGGGGGSAINYQTSVDNGGDAGGTVGSSSTGVADQSTAATGGTQTQGGTGNKWGSTWSASTNGSLGLGSDAGVGTGGGGGGGGYYGGAGGSWTGGGGGSSFTDATYVSLVTHTPGARTGNGLVTISYTPALPILTTSIAGNVRTVSKGKSVVITTNSDQAGNLIFMANGKRIPGCISKAAIVGNNTCSWKPAITGAVKITVMIYQSGTLKSSSNSLDLVVSKRVDAR